MNYTYTIRKVDTENRLLSVIYHADGKPDYHKNFRTEMFSSADAEALIHQFSPTVRHFWEALDTPIVAEVNNGDQGAGVATKQVHMPPEEIDPFTQKHDERVDYNSSTGVYTHTYVVVPKTDEEIVEYQFHVDDLEKQEKFKVAVEMLAARTLAEGTLSDEEKQQLEGAWQFFTADTAYSVGDKVYYRGKAWQCVQAYTSSASTRPDDASVYWVLV